MYRLIRCDSIGCPACVEAATAAGAEFDALVAGWHHDGGDTWLCPDHAPQPRPAHRRGGYIPAARTQAREWELRRIEKRLCARLGLARPDLFAGTPDRNPVTSAVTAAYLVGRDDR